MSHQCVSIRSKGNPTERCSYQAKPGTLWCGHHAKQKKPIVYVSPGPAPKAKVAAPAPAEPTERVAVRRIACTWRRWQVRRRGPLLWFREESNNPTDFYSGDSVTDIPIRDFVSFVDGGKGYCMELTSALSLVEHSGSGPVLNPFNRAPLPALFLKRLQFKKAPVRVPPTTSMTVTDLFRFIEDLGYYTDPSWVEDMNRIGLIRFYIEIADIWFHRATLRAADRARIVPGSVRPISVPILDAGRMDANVLRPILVETCRLLVSTAADRADRQLGVMYVLGALCMIHDGAAAAYPWLVEMFAPGVTRITADGRVGVVHPAVLNY
jgi:hypothetical protein